MDRWATKDTYEREGDEASRLVRPAPKVKPPRLDKRREVTHSDRDPDTSGDPDLKGDRDMSLNYKNVGGSLVERVAGRYTEARGLPSYRPKGMAAQKPRSNVGKPSRKPNPKTDDKYVLVWDQKIQKNVSRPESETKNNPRYQKAKPQEEQGEPKSETTPPATERGEKPSEKPSAPKPSREEADPAAGKPERAEEPSAAGKPSLDVDPKVAEQLQSLAASDPKAKAFFESALKPESPLLAISKDRPDFPLPKLPGIELPASITTVGQLIRHLQAPTKPKGKEKAEKARGKGEVAPSAAQADPKQTEAKERLDQIFQNDSAKIDSFVESLPFSDRDEQGKVTVYDKKRKKHVPLDAASPEVLHDIVDRYEKKKLSDETQAVLRGHESDPAVVKALRDLHFLGGGTKEKGEEEGPLAQRIRALQKEGHPLESLSVSKHVPELKGVKLPKDIRTVKDLVDAVAQSGRKKPEPPETDEASNQAKRVVERFTADKLKSDEFRAFADALPTTSRDKAGNPVFVDTTKKPKKRVPFDKLPENLQAEIVEKFESAQQSKARAKAMSDFIAANPKLRSVFDQLAAAQESTPEKAEGPITQRIRALKEDGHPLDELDARKHVPELGGVDLPDGVETVADLVEASRLAQPPKPRHREVPAEEAEKIAVRVWRHLPVEVAKKVLALHPADQLAVVEGYLKLKNAKPEDRGDFEEQLRKVYQTDPSKIDVPEKIEYEGKIVSLSSLSPQDQADAVQAYKNRVLSVSLAGQDIITRDLTKDGLPQSLAHRLVGTFDKSAPPPQETYTSVLTDGRDERPLDAATTKRIFDHLSDDQKSTATAYLQARDYQDLRRKFLDSASPEAFTERSSTRDILKGLTRATKAVRDREALYPEVTGIDNAYTFRHRVLERLDALGIPKEKGATIHKWVAEQDADDYDKAYAQWQKAYRKADTERQKAQSRGPYRGESLPDLPPEPVKPATYESVRPSKPDRSRGRKLMDFMKGLIRGKGAAPTVVTARVAARYLTCMGGEVMASDVSGRSRQAVYWGVEPYPVGHEGFAPYNEWEQAHSRDLNAEDFSLILKAAKDWLQQPILDLATMDSTLPDVRFRAALDFALQTVGKGKYSVGLHPALYNQLLARLSGQPEDATLLTVRQAAEKARKSPYRQTLERITMRASTQIRSFAAKIANHQPSMAFDLMELADKVAQQEQGQQEQGQQEQGQPEQGQPEQGQQKQAGELPPALKEHMKKKEEAKGEKEEGEQGQQKQAYQTLRSAVIRLASENPQARIALQPILHTIKQIG
jgi:hypothetical protein